MTDEQEVGNSPDSEVHVGGARLNKVFSRVPIGDVKPRHAYRYLDLVAGKHGQASANRDYEVLSYAFSVAIRWGLIDSLGHRPAPRPGPAGPHHRGDHPPALPATRRAGEAGEIACDPKPTFRLEDSYSQVHTLCHVISP